MHPKWQRTWKRGTGATSPSEADRDNKSSLLSSIPSTASSSSSSSVPERQKPVAGDVVTIRCRLVPEGDFVPEPLIDGIVFYDHDDAMQPLSFVLGGGNYLPGLHELILSSMKISNAENNSTCVVRNESLDAGWGARNPALVATLKYEAAGVADPDQIQHGTELLLQNGLKCSVTERNNESFTIDANPPLAGASYRATVELLNVEAGPKPIPYSETDSASFPSSRYEVATFALGCFWGAELEFMRVSGVVGTSVGYSQGTVKNPTYEQVCSGETDHAECVLVSFDPDVVSYQRLVEIAMERLGESKYLLNQVGNDRGAQYRHGVYYSNPTQKQVAEAVLSSYGEDCVTECKPATEWYPAEDYHQQYLLKGGQSARKKDKTPIRCYG
jgi:peptide-methionine (S)-S-oxide reductase